MILIETAVNCVNCGLNLHENVDNDVTTDSIKLSIATNALS